MCKTSCTPGSVKFTKSMAVPVIFVLLTLCNFSVGATNRAPADGAHIVDDALTVALNEWDLDGSGTVDMEEFGVVYEKLFELADAHDDHGHEDGDHDEHDHDEGAHDSHDEEHDSHAEEDHDEHDHDESVSSSASSHEEHDSHDHEEDSHEEHDSHDEEHDSHDEEHDSHDEEHDSHDEEHDSHDEEHDSHDEEHEEHDEEHDSHDEEHDSHDEEHDSHDEEHEEHDEEHDEEEEGHEHEEKWRSHAKRTDPSQVHCYEMEDIFHAYDVNDDGDWDAGELSPAMHEVLLMVFHDCGASDVHDEHEDEESDCKEPERWEAWLYALLATLVISLASLLGIILIPVKSRIFKKILLEIMVAFAVGTLTGSAIFELIPTAFELHAHNTGESDDSHDSHDSHGEEEDTDERNYLWGGAVVCVGILFFFLLERIIAMVFYLALSVWDRYHPDEDGEGLDDEEQPKKEVGGHSHGGVDMFSGSKKRLRAVGVLNLFTDAVHNFIDGLAIGVAWRNDLGTGLATSLAILFHEVPQEFGDFAVLIYAGFAKWQALLFNLTSALIAFAGTILGLLIGGAVQDADRWILAITAGGFLYMALVDMLSEIKDIKGIGHTIAQFTAILIGMAIMFIIAIFEEDLGGCGHGGH